MGRIGVEKSSPDSMSSDCNSRQYREIGGRLDGMHAWVVEIRKRWKTLEKEFSTLCW